MKKEVANSPLERLKERLKNSEPVTDAKRDLLTFVCGMKENAEASLSSNIPDDATRARLREAVAKLDHSMPDLIWLIEASSDPDHYMIKLWEALWGAFSVGYGTTTKENAGAVEREGGRKVNKRSVVARLNNPVSQIIRSVVDRLYSPGDEEHSHSMGQAMMDDVNRELDKVGKPPLKRPDRIARAIRRRGACNS